MKMNSLMENLYLGILDKNRLNYSEAFVDDPDVVRVIEEFKKISSDYPPGLLESLGKVPDELMDRLKRMGFFGLLIPQEFGGSGFSLHQYIRAVEQIVKIDMALAIVSLAHLSIGMKAILLFGNEDQKNKYLPKAASGEMVFAYALTEPLIGSDAKNIKTTAYLSPDGKEYILDGTKTFITNANYAQGLTVFAQMDPDNHGTLGAFIVETGMKGVTVGNDMEKMGLKASSTAAIILKDVHVPKENLIGKPGDGFKIAMTVLNYGRLALGAASSGIMEISIDDMLKRAASRIQFEKPILSYQLIQEKIALSYIHKVIISSMTNLTASMLDKNPLDQVPIESSHCKLYGTTQAWNTLYEAMQVSGGSGYLKTMPFEKRMRDFRVTTIFEGTSEIHSIYPPLSFLKDFMKQFKKLKFFGKLKTLFGMRFKVSFWSFETGMPIVKKAGKMIRRITGIYRRLLLKGIRIYKSNIGAEEYFLRRLTWLSCESFILLSLSAHICYKEKYHLDMTSEKIALEYSLNHAAKIIHDNRRFASRKEEYIFQSIINQLSSGDGG